MAGLPVGIQADARILQAGEIPGWLRSFSVNGEGDDNPLDSGRDASWCDADAFHVSSFIQEDPLGRTLWVAKKHKVIVPAGLSVFIELEGVGVDLEFASIALQGHEEILCRGEG